MGETSNHPNLATTPVIYSQIKQSNTIQIK